jgi:hypothetical protein
MLAGLLSGTARGPRREGVYAVWLVVRVAGDLGLTPPIAERAHHRRLDALARRLSSLTVPPPLRRALTGALLSLAESTPESAAIALQQLMAPVRDSLGGEAAEAVTLAARAAKAGVRNLDAGEPKG